MTNAPTKEQIDGSINAVEQKVNDIPSLDSNMQESADEAVKLGKEYSATIANAARHTAEILSEYVTSLRNEAAKAIEVLTAKNAESGLTDAEAMDLGAAIITRQNILELDNQQPLYLFAVQNKVDIEVAQCKPQIVRAYDVFKHYCRSRKLRHADMMVAFDMVDDTNADFHKSKMVFAYYVFKMFEANKKTMDNRILYMHLTTQVLLTAFATNASTQFIEKFVRTIYPEVFTENIFNKSMDTNALDKDGELSDKVEVDEGDADASYVNQ
jgi:hypothetical protein